MTRSLLVPAVVALALATTGLTAGAASADVVGTVTNTVVPGGALTVTGTAVSAGATGTPGAFGAAPTVSALSVSDLTGTSNGWRVVATYSAPATNALLGGATVQDVGGANVEVSTSYVSGAVATGDITRVTDQPLTSPLTVASTNAGKAGSGVTALTAAYKVRLPETSKIGEVFGGTVTYTVLSAR